MLSILPPYERSDRDADRPFKSYPKVPLSVPSDFYSHYSASAFVGRHNPGPTPASHRGALDLSGMDLRHGMPPLDGSHMADPSHQPQRDPHGGHHMPPQMPPVYSQHPQHPPNHDAYLGRPGQPAPLPPNNNSHGHMQNNHEPLHGATSHSSPEAPPALSPSSDSKSSIDHSIGSSRIPPKKRPLSVPDEAKDQSYWEKRKKNNESAKRSRDARRMKEEQLAMRVVYLEQENLQLRTEVSLLKSEIEKLRNMFYNSHSHLGQ